MENEKIEVKNAGIDPHVLDIMKQQDVLETLKDEKLAKRAELNFFCEMLSSVKELNNTFQEFMNFLTICSADKLSSFFKELQTNVESEKVRANVQKKVRKSHQKAKNKKKIQKKSKNNGDLSKNSVK